MKLTATIEPSVLRPVPEKVNSSSPGAVDSLVAGAAVAVGLGMSLGEALGELGWGRGDPAAPGRAPGEHAVNDRASAAAAASAAIGERGILFPLVCFSTSEHALRVDRPRVLIVHVVVAPDSFKGSLDAAAAAEAIGSGWRAVRPLDEVLLLPQADGGEGTLDAIATAVDGARLHDVGPVTGPDGRPVDGHWLELPDGTAVVELALSSGLPLMTRLDPLGATTRGLGEVITAALDAGATSLVVGLGGSASTDGGAGALRALGLGLFDDSGATLPEGGGALMQLARLDVSGLRRPPVGGVRLLSDVTAPLLGPTGAAAVFGPQKGASAAQVVELDAALARWASLLARVPVVTDGPSPPEDAKGKTTAPGSGAAGGTGYGFVAAWGAALESGATALAELTGFAAAAASADVIVTGEGRFDATSLTGKVVGNALSLEAAPHTRRAIIAGGLASAPPAGVWAISLVELAGSLGAALDDPSRWLYAAGATAARALG
ncbi:MAG TPA: glycerate kinase [Pseudolysinimonas sp.]|nr:glycerate kinase [Pseudolysinimonas sp.]